MDNSINTETLNKKLKNDGQVKWGKEHEEILIEWADKAMCYRWLHSKSHKLYSNLNTWYTIPVIIISTLTGTANFAQDRVPKEWQSTFVMTIGGFNILAGIITTIQQFLKITQLNESHRVSSIAWDKFYRNIKIELSKHPSERLNVVQMITICKEEYDRLMETSPVIPDKIIKNFKESFGNTSYYSTIRKPEICDELISTETFKNQWTLEENLHINKFDNEDNDKRSYIQQIEEFKNNFFEINNRYPIENEIIDNLQEKIDVNILKTLLENVPNEEI